VIGIACSTQQHMALQGSTQQEKQQHRAGHEQSKQYTAVQGRAGQCTAAQGSTGWYHVALLCSFSQQQTCAQGGVTDARCHLHNSTHAVNTITCVACMLDICVYFM
jgi:hypothetical protein